MILEFSISNFRSIKDTAFFSLIAESSKAKANNITVHSLATDDVRLLNTAVIYGANGSGKSNVLRAFYNLLHFIKTNESKAGQDIDFYDPFLFDLNTDTKQVSFNVNFIGPENVKYTYVIEFNKRDVTKEELSYFPKGKETLLFKRISEGSSQELTHIGKLGSSLGNKEVKVFHNRLILAKFGEEDASEELLTKIFVHFDKYEVINSHVHINHPNLISEINQLFYNDALFNNKLNDLIKRSDVKIKRVEIESNNLENTMLDDEVSNNVKRTSVERNAHSLYGIHDLYNANEKISERGLSFNNESKGTRSLFILGGKILATLNSGGCLFVDELETSFHPDLSRTLVELFHSTATNPLGAQLVFTTHDVTLLSRSLFRKDQIWFTEKNDKGATDLFSAQDFKEAREDTPFDRWYMAGKFGALPFIDMRNDDPQD